MNFEKIWFWFSAVLAASTTLFFGLNIPLSLLDGFWGLDFYHFIILGVIIFPFLLKYLVKKANEKNFPNYFLWSVFFFVISFSLFFLAVMMFRISGLQGLAGFIGLYFVTPACVLFLVVGSLFFYKSRKLP